MRLIYCDRFWHRIMRYSIQRDTIRNVPVMRQLELNLLSEAECAADAWKYRFTSDALVEEVDSKRVVYGLWGKLFGCWVTNPATGQWREIIPTWQPLSQNGVWRDQRDIRFLADDERRRPYSSRWRCEANAAFAGYFAEIPQRVRSVVAAMGHYQWLALDLIWHEPDFAQFLDEELFNDRQQYLFACFGLGDAVNLPRARRREFARTLMGGKRTDVLSELLKSGCTKSNIRSIYKLGEEPCEPAIYEKLIRLSARSIVSKALSHAEYISPRAIEFLWNLPEEYLLPKLVRMILDQGLAIDEIDTDHEATVIADLHNIRQMHTKLHTNQMTRVTSSIEAVRTFSGLAKWTRKWKVILIQLIGFPPPPIPGNHHLVPVSSASQMRREGRDMRNCVQELIPSVVAGIAYFYHWGGCEAATVVLLNNPSHGWFFGEARGHDNKPLSDQTNRFLRATVTEALSFQEKLVDQNALADG